MVFDITDINFLSKIFAFSCEKENQTAGGHPTLKDGVCFGPPARLLGDR
ncbi:Type I restriction-modification system, specificity subunit S [Methanosarcina mazei WWM610]|uniref:Type I restriction-modification system, specificity subunit S n=1 Tax=Methanosarcina mazei WWM610 TaxID=1434117 RepID=A0A0E3Q0V9_METMZ|nr:Type I restriction-modification system, specificity subunit S [Methanosarcina mazei WWM610]